MAISLVILVGGALATLATYFALDASRTRSEAAEAQLRQLLNAGAIAAIEHADAAGQTKLQLPAELGHATVSIQVRGSGDAREAVVDAHLNERALSQSLKMHRVGNKWTVISASLDDDAQPPAATQPSERSTAASQRS